MHVAPALIGWVAIAQALNITRNTAARYAQLPEDALPVRLRRGTPRIHPTYLDEWRRRRKNDPDLPKLRGWAAICAVLDGCDIDTAALWAKRDHDRLPVQGMGTRRPWAYASAVRDWALRGDAPVAPQRRAAKMTARRVSTPRNAVTARASA